MSSSDSEVEIIAVILKRPPVDSLIRNLKSPRLESPSPSESSSPLDLAMNIPPSPASSTPFSDSIELPIDQCETDSKPLDLSITSMKEKQEFSDNDDTSLLPLAESINPSVAPYLYVKDPCSSTSGLGRAALESQVHFQDYSMPFSVLSTQGKVPEIIQIHSSASESFQDSPASSASDVDFSELSTQPNNKLLTPSPCKPPSPPYQRPIPRRKESHVQALFKDVSTSISECSTESKSGEDVIVIHSSCSNSLFQPTASSTPEPDFAELSTQQNCNVSSVSPPVTSFSSEGPSTYVSYGETPSQPRIHAYFTDPSIPFSELPTPVKGPFNGIKTTSSPLKRICKDVPPEVDSSEVISTQPNRGLDFYATPYRTRAVPVELLEEETLMSFSRSDHPIMEDHFSIENKPADSPLWLWEFPTEQHTQDDSLLLNKKTDGNDSQEVPVRIQEDPNLPKIRDQKRCEKQMIESHVRMEHKNDAGELVKITNTFSFCNHAGHTDREIIQMTRNLWLKLSRINNEGENGEWPDHCKVIIGDIPSEAVFPTRSDSDSCCSTCDSPGLRALSKFRSGGSIGSEEMKTKNIPQLDGSNDMEGESSSDDENNIKSLGICKKRLFQRDESRTKGRGENKKENQERSREGEKRNGIELKRNCKRKNKVSDKNNEMLLKKDKPILKREPLVMKNKKLQLNETKTTMGSFRVVDAVIGKQKMLDKKTEPKKPSTCKTQMINEFIEEGMKGPTTLTSQAARDTLIEYENEKKIFMGMLKLQQTNLPVKPDDDTPAKKQKIDLEQEIKIILDRIKTPKKVMDLEIKIILEPDDDTPAKKQKIDLDKEIKIILDRIKTPKKVIDREVKIMLERLPLNVVESKKIVT